MRIVAPTRSDPVLRRLTEVVGGPLGRHSEPGVVAPGFFTVERVLIVLTVVAAVLSVVVKQYCRVNGWHTPEHFYAACYSDWGELFHQRGLDVGVIPFITPGERFEYPVLLGALAGLTALLVPGSGASVARSTAYFDINAVLTAATWIVTVVATVRMSHRRPWDAAMVAVAPAVILSATINWDFWAVMLAALAMLAFARDRPVLAGVLIGLGTAVKLYPVLLLGAILVLAIRSGRWRPFLLSAATAAGSWLVVNLPLMLTDYTGWRYFLDFTRERPAGYSSFWYVQVAMADRLHMPPAPVPVINTLSTGLFVLCCVGIAVLALTARRRPRMGQLVFLIVAAFVLTNKVYSPQYVLWLVPLLALARPRWRSFLVWQVIEVLHWAATWLYLGQLTSGGNPQHNIDILYYSAAVLAHMGALIYLMAAVVREIRRPELDVVRRQGIDDPQGGPFVRAGDVLPWLAPGPGPRPDRVAPADTGDPQPRL
nr:glycosyltransferase 87 family protein [Tersicoccus solisilvae]